MSLPALTGNSPSFPRKSPKSLFSNYPSLHPMQSWQRLLVHVCMYVCVRWTCVYVWCGVGVWCLCVWWTCVWYLCVVCGCGGRVCVLWGVCGVCVCGTCVCVECLYVLMCVCVVCGMLMLYLLTQHFSGVEHYFLHFSQQNPHTSLGHYLSKRYPLYRQEKDKLSTCTLKILFSQLSSLTVL